MASIGLPVIRVAQQASAIYYFYQDPRTQKKHAFWTDAAGGEVFWCSGVSSGARRIAESFTAAGLFTNDERHP
ncbi:MAG: hypothetical protein V4710_18250 [Verrucomicrobiota bacterium]